MKYKMESKSVKEDINYLEPALLNLEQTCKYLCIEKLLAEDSLRSMHMSLLYA